MVEKEIDEDGLLVQHHPDEEKANWNFAEWMWKRTGFELIL